MEKNTHSTHCLEQELDLRPFHWCATSVVACSALSQAVLEEPLFHLYGLHFLTAFRKENVNHLFYNIGWRE